MEGVRYGIHEGEEMGKILRRVFTNRGFLNSEDVKVLEFLSKKGDHESKKAILIDKEVQNPLYEFMEKNYPKTLDKYKKLKMIVKS